MATTTFPDGIDTSQDYLYWTNTITVNYLSKAAEAPPADYAGIEVDHVMWFSINKAFLPADSLLLKFDRTFRLLAKAVMQGVTPKGKDIIIDDQGIRWMIGIEKDAVEILSFGNEFRVHTIKSMKPNSVPVT
jgi:hypothetical protein